jgi:methionyl-tRNA formyltransferase
MSVNVILCGYNWIGCKILELLIERQYNLYVFTHESPYYVNDLIKYCSKKDVEYTIEKISIKNLPFKPDVVVSAYYQYIISSDIIDACGHKIFNLHPSLLPLYKGCSSLTWAMINGEKTVGYTYHYITKEIDCGNIIYQQELALEDFDTQVTLYHRVMFEAFKSFYLVFDLVLNGVIGNAQDALSNNYNKRGCPFNGVINENWDESKIERFIRAMIYPPLSVATFNGKPIYSIDDL